MRYLVAACLFFTITACGTTTSVTNLDAQARANGQSKIPQSLTPHVDGQIMVRFNDNVQSEQVTAIIQQLDCHILTRYNDSQLFHLELPTGLSVTEAVREFASLEEVAFAEPNYVLSTEPYDI